MTHLPLVLGLGLYIPRDNDVFCIFLFLSSCAFCFGGFVTHLLRRSWYYFCLLGRIWVRVYTLYVTCIRAEPHFVFMIVRLLFCFIDLIKIPETSPSVIRNETGGTTGQVENGAQAPVVVEIQLPTPTPRGAAVFRILDRNSAFSPTTRR